MDRDPAVGGRRLALAGIASAVVASGATELGASVSGWVGSPLLAVGDLVVSRSPAWVVNSAVSVFGSANRAALTVGMILVVVVAGAGLGVLAARSVWLASVGFAVFGVLATFALHTEAEAAVTAAGAVAGAGLIVGVLTLRILMALAIRDARVDEQDLDRKVRTDPQASVPPPEQDPTIRRPTRRAFLAATGAALTVGVAAGAAGWTLRGAADVRATGVVLPTPSRPLPPVPAGADFAVDGLSPAVTPNDQFFRIDTALIPPRVDTTTHTVRITGMVDHPFELSLDELVAMADVEQDVTLSCVSNRVGGELVGHARWQGVPVSRLLEQAGVQPGAEQVVGHSVDRWTGGFPLEAVLDGRPALVAVGMNGEPLPVRHGFPARLVIAGLYGYVANTKWLSEIELTTWEAHQAYWVPLGWSDRAPIKVQSRIDVPVDASQVPAGPTTLAGVAWADERGLSGVEVSVDAGPWHAAELSEPLSAASWRQWRLSWDASAGPHEIRVRALDAQGRAQTPDVQPPQPDGATGHHTITVTVS